jgi:hypothetical protein
LETGFKNGWFLVKKCRKLSSLIGVYLFAGDGYSGDDYYPFGMQMPGRKYQQGSSSYRYSINGQEKEKELTENITTAQYWEYDSRIGRRWNVDPVLKSWESTYSCFLSSPIWLNDVKGNIFDKATKSDKRAEKVQKLANERIDKLKKWASGAEEKINKLKGKISEQTSKVGVNGYTQEKADKEIASLNKKIEFQTSEKADFDLKIGFLTKSVTEIEQMKTDAEVYIYEDVTGSLGGTYRRESDKAIIMKVTSDENALHESTHAKQIHDGKITGTGEKTMVHTDLFGEELEAYRRQYSLDPNSVKREAPSYPRDAARISDLNRSWLLGLHADGVYPYLEILMGKKGIPENEAIETLDLYNRK